MMVVMKVILVLCIWNVGLFEAAPFDLLKLNENLLEASHLSDFFSRCEPERCTISDGDREVCTTKYRDGDWCLKSYPPICQQVPYEDCCYCY